MGECRLSAQEDTLEIGVEKGVPHLFSDLPCRDETLGVRRLHSHQIGGATRVVHQDVQAAEFIDHTIESGVDRVCFGDIEDKW